ncbi:hypothetical protein L0F63_001248, partial [Massospora cicadina]
MTQDCHRVPEGAPHKRVAHSWRSSAGGLTVGDLAQLGPSPHSQPTLSGITVQPRVGCVSPYQLDWLLQSGSSSMLTVEALVEPTKSHPALVWLQRLIISFGLRSIMVGRFVPSALASAMQKEHALRPSLLLRLLSLPLEVQYGALCCPLPPSNLVHLTLPPKSTPANQSNALTTIGTQAAAHLPNPTHPNLNATIPVNQNPWDLLAETDESGNVLISKHTGQPLCQGNYGWAEFFLSDFDETPTPRHFAPLPNTAPFQSDHQLALAAVASPHCLKLCTAVAQSMAQLQHGLPTLFLPPNFPESPCSDILKLFNDAEVAVINVTTIASFNPSAKITCHSISLFTQLPEACKEAEVLLAAFVETLSHHYLDVEEENSYYADLNPHYVDAPTPWLSALI